MWRRPISLVFAAAAAAWLTAAVAARQDTTFLDPEHPAIQYATGALDDPVARLNRTLQNGSVRLTFDGPNGYLRSVVDALHVPIDSQLAVFSRTSLQSPLINPRNPRSIYFNDSIAVAWPRGGFIEIAAQDPRQGAIFYLLEQVAKEKPAFIRSERCLSCHFSYASMSVPGMLTRSIVTEANGATAPQLGNYTSDHRSPFAERWAGWFVTGRSGSLQHLGNMAVADGHDPDAVVAPRTSSLDSLQAMFDTTGYLTPHSDIVALLVFNHQMRMMNLLTHIGWQARIEGADAPDKVAASMRAAAREVVDYLLFVDEAALPSRVEGTSGFAERFSALGPRDMHGRSLRQLDLVSRVMRYPCSYMIYSDAFDGLPTIARDAIYERLWQVLSGRDTEAKYSRLGKDDRQAIIEILRDTKAGLPRYFF